MRKRSATRARLASSAAVLLAMAALAGCSGWGGGAAEERDPAVERVENLADVFYFRISNRRFNSVATFQDPGLREFFRSRESFADYFADFVQDLIEGRFQKFRALEAQVRKVEILEPGVAKVTVRFRGKNARPLRWWDVRLTREDRWEEHDGIWWIIPGRL